MGDEYREQLKQIESALDLDPDNAELRAVKQQLEEVLALMAETKTTSAASKKRTSTGSDDDDDDNNNNKNNTNNDDDEDGESDDSGDAATTTATTTHGIASGAPQKVGEWGLGAAVSAIWSGDGAWYDAVVKGITAKSELVLEFEGYGDEETVPIERVRARDAAAEKRKKPEDPYAELPIPPSLKILPSDSEEVRERKRKRVKAIKSKNRLRRIEREKNGAASSWKTFLNKKASAKAVTGELLRMIFC